MNDAQSVSPLALDMGGTWIKFVRFGADGSFEELERMANPCDEPGLCGEAFAERLADEILRRTQGMPPGALVISTAGEIDAAGHAYRYLAAHLGAMADPAWIVRLEERLECPLCLINDTEALATHHHHVQAALDSLVGHASRAQNSNK